ncbi:hypothetical protein HFO07_26720 [Rhizobium leguminosarum]|nr:hypothetical protein [Rhizobium leguminosarum]MBY5760208.1 hypothetical protein [Rhizobium leguminosarum]
MSIKIRSHVTALAFLMAIVTGAQSETNPDSSQYEVAILKVSSTVS